MGKINRSNIADHLVDYQLGMVGRTRAEAYKTDEWYHKWTMTTQQFEEWKAYSIPLIKKVFKCNKRVAENQFGWLNMQFGLRIDDTPPPEEEPERL